MSTNSPPEVPTSSQSVGAPVIGGQPTVLATVQNVVTTAPSALAGLGGRTCSLTHAPSIGVGVGPRLFAAAGHLVTPIPAAFSSSPLGAGSSLHSAANIRHFALSTAVVSSSAMHRQLSIPAGMMVVPSLGASHPSTGLHAPLLVQSIKDVNELQILHAQQLQQQRRSPGLSPVSPRGITMASPAATTATSPSGGTIHHLGQSPLSRGGINTSPLLTNPLQQQLSMMSGNQQQSSQQQQLLQGVVSQLSRQQQLTVSGGMSAGASSDQQRRSSGSRGSGQTSPGASTSELLPSQPGATKPLRTSPLQSPERARKRIKLEEIPAATPEIANKRKLICDEKLKEMARLKVNYKEHLSELFFLQNGGNLMEYFTWKKRPSTQLLHFLKSGTLDSDDEEENQEKSINNEVKVLTTSGGTVPLATPVAIATSLPASVASASQDQSKRQGGRHGMVFGHLQPSQSVSTPQMPGGIPLSTTAATTTVGSPPPYSSATTTPVQSQSTTITTATATITTSTNSVSLSSALAKIMMNGIQTTAGGNGTSQTSTSSRSGPRPHISAVYDHTLGSQEAIVERAKQEAQVMQRVAELRKEGLWSTRRLPKVQEPPRNKAHWDYLLEEMQWLAADFAQERKWKKAGARKIARMITKHFQELHQKGIKAEKDEVMKTRRIAGSLAKMVKEFWTNIEKVVQYKQQSRLEEKRKKALDLHLSFIVDQTEKYSSWLTEGLSVAGASSSRAGSVGSSAPPDDGDFEPTMGESDDEETIEQEEQNMDDDDQQSTKDEIAALQKDSELPIEELLKTLPKEVLEKPASLEPEDDTSPDAKKHKDEDFKSEEEDSDDDEQTLAEQEKKEKKSDHSQELQELEDEGQLSMEELYKKYAGAYESDFENELSDVSDEDSDDMEEEEDDDEEEEEEDIQSDEEEEEMEAEEDVGIDFLAKNLEADDKASSTSQESAAVPNKEITDIAEAAQSIQPTGYTLETTQVRTKVPFLLKHTLREYQHVGLEWLATLYERKLNGILADEMGLGKTIQTIAALAHLATEWGIWGPHLIVVPTSVMLNWEMEFKKWCPAFKILTYYGNQKERKLKRTGWTKTNAFHVCITSYKLVIQDHQSFRRKKWKYFILDEAQNIKNFKSQRWQTLLNFQSQRRLLLTGTPLQNSLMELWSLMHFLMPHVFQSHREFKEWFANPLSGMIEGSREYNETLIKRLHKVLRPFLLRRLKQDVEKQMPKKYEHVVMCRLSKRQRFLYDDFMSQTKTKETLATGHFMSVINILMQLRKVCNHPNLFDPRPIQSPFQMEGLVYNTPSSVLTALHQDPLESIDLNEWHPNLAGTEMDLCAFAAHRIKKLQTPNKLIEEIDSLPEEEPLLQKPPVGHCKPFVFRSYSPIQQSSGEGRSSPFVPIQNSTTTVTQSASSSTSTVVSSGNSETTVATGQTSTSAAPTSAGQSLQAKELPTATTVSTSSAVVSTAAVSTTPVSQVLTSHPITLQIHQTQQGTKFMIPSSSLSQLPAGYIQIVQTSSGQQFIATTSQPLQQTTSNKTTVVNGPSITVSTVATTSTVPSVVRPVSTVTLPASSAAASSGKPVVKVSPLTPKETPESELAKTAVVKPTPVIGTSQITTRNAKAALKKNEDKSEFFLSSLADKRTRHRDEQLQRLSSYNQKRCGNIPVYGQDLHHAVSVMTDLPTSKTPHCPWKSLGFIHCCRVTQCSNPNHPKVFWNQTEALKGMIRTPESFLKCLQEVIERFVFAIPSVTAPRIKMHSSHPPPSWLQQQRHLEFTLNKTMAPKAAGLHSIVSRMSVQFPELRLIEYDCGKLQTLDLLLHRLKSGAHRVLIFTQMTRMLDVLEQFLSYHGHRYLRLDGTTKVEQRQVLMDRFNMDKRIFCFILSTRSGGIGVNLTGADTVIFYDSDWNPTMDAQAQDRCHRIGQTRDVHIYRLISQMTVEENILKKANQKRLLGNVAIEGGNFTSAFFKQQTISELFEEPSGLESFAKEIEKKESEGPTPTQKTPTVPARSLRSTEKRAPTPVPEAQKDSMTTDQLEQALGAAEEDTDIQAAKVVKAEQKAELAEFDENIPWDEREAELKKERDEEISKVEQELQMLEKELTSVERYAVQYVEGQNQSFAEEELQKAEEEVTLAKEEWELSRLQALKEEEERKAELEEDEMLFTYSRDDAYSQVYINAENGEHMPMWAPPTPPQEDNDVYIDRSICFLYEPSVMPESQLPPVYVKKEHKRIRIDPAIAAVARKQKVRKEEHHRVPRSLFDRPQSLLRREREMKIMKLKQLHKPMKPQLLNQRPLEGSDGHPDWLIHEDWALLQALQMLQELPPTLSTDTPAIIPNWDLVADMVNACSRTYRSIKQCKNRYENVVVPREEGKILYDVNPRKQKKTKGIYKTKNNRPMRTSQLFVQDNSTAVTTLYSLRFDSCKAIAAKRTPTIRPTLANPTLKNPKHAAVLAENGINYETPLTPTQVATNRAERIAKEKQKNQEAAQQLAAQRPTTTQTTTTPVATTAVAQVTQAIAAAATGQTATVAGQPQMTIVQGQQLQTAVSGPPTTVIVTQAGTLPKATAGSTVAAVSLARTLGPTGSIVVNQGNGNAFAAINKRIAGQTVVGSIAQTLASTSTTSIAQAVRAARASQIVQDISPAKVGAAGTSTPITPAHIIAAQKGGTVTVSNISAGSVQPQATTKMLTPQQLQILRLKQQQYRKLTAIQAAAQQASAGQAGAVGQAGQKTVAVTTPLITSITQSAVTPARLQLAKQQGLKGTTVSRSLSEAEMTVLLKRQQLQQRALSVASGATIVSQGSPGVQQVTQGHVTRLTTAQIITGTQVQQVQAGQSTTGSSQPVATLVKTVSTQGGASVPSVTIPVTAVSLGISVNVPTPKMIAGKNITQMRQIHLQQLQRNQKLTQQKVATLGQFTPVGKGPGGTTPLLIPQQQQALPKVMVQQIVKQQPSQGATIQQIIVPPSQTTTATVIATQLVTQAQPTVQTVTKMSVPSGSITSAVTQATRGAASTPMAVTAVPVSATTPAASQAVTLATTTLVSGSSTVTLTPSHTTLVKNLQEVMISPQKTVSIQSATGQQVKTLQAATVRQIAGTSLAHIQTTTPAIQVQHLTGAGSATASAAPKLLASQQATVVQQLVHQNPIIQQPPPGVQQAVQKVLQESHAQAQHRVAGTSATTTATVVVSTTSTSSQPQLVQQIVTATAAGTPQQGGGNQGAGDAQAGGKGSPYTMRPRNTRSDSGSR